MRDKYIDIKPRKTGKTSTVYISESGCDETGNGSKEKPFRTTQGMLKKFSK